jgi:hypothetical protein
MITITNYYIAVLHNTYIKNAGSWVDKLVEHLLSTAAIDSMSFRRAQPPPTSPRNGYARIQNIMHGAV